MTLYARLMTYSLISGIVITVPFWPPMLTVMTGQMKHTQRYFRTIRKGFTHLRALIKMRAIHRYFSGEGNQPPQKIAQNIGGFCNRCGQCCLERRCMFLEKHSDAEYLCGIYGTWLRESCERDHDFGFAMLKRTSAIVIQRLQAARKRLVESESKSLRAASGS